MAAAAVQSKQPPLLVTQVEQAVEVFTKSHDPIAKQNASGMLGFLASTRPDCCSAIARCEGVVEAVAVHLADASQDMQHNVALLLVLLARGSVAFRRSFSAHAEAMEALLSLLACEDSDTVCNTLWALRHLVVEGIHRDTTVRKRTAAIIKPLTQSPDMRVATNAKAVADILHRPVPIDTSIADDDEAVAGLASILHTPPPSAAPRNIEAHTQSVEPSAQQRPKRKSSPASSQRDPAVVGLRQRKRLQRREEGEEDNVLLEQGQQEFEEQTPAEVVEENPEDDEAAGALAYLIQAAEG